MKISEIKALNTVAEVERPISPHREDTSSSSEGSLVSSIVRNDAMRRGVGLRVSYFGAMPARRAPIKNGEERQNSRAP
jgi:hypothetical protein